MRQNMGASPLATGLAGAEAPEPHSRLGPSDGIPSAWPLLGYAPGAYMGRCHDCGTQWCDQDKRSWQCLECAVRAANAALETYAAIQRQPVPMILHCPECSARHIDEGEFADKPHHTHACQSCGMVWRPAKGPTVGVQFLPGFKNEDAIAIEARQRTDPEEGLDPKGESAGLEEASPRHQ